MNRVNPTGDLFRFYVDSSRPGRTAHFVDLKAWWLNGCCDCEDFMYRCAPLLAKRRLLTQDARDRLPPIICKHIEAAQRYSFREMLRRLSHGEVLTETGE